MSNLLRRAIHFYFLENILPFRPRRLPRPLAVDEPTPPLSSQTQTHQHGRPAVRVNLNHSCFSASRFEDFKGDLFRAGIRHLESLQKEVDQRRADNIGDTGSREYLDKAGILGALMFPTDEEALEYTDKTIADALITLKGLIRHKGSSLMLGDLKSVEAALTMHPEQFDDIFDLNYRSTVIQQQESAPLELHRVGLRGLWQIAKLRPANVKLLYPCEVRELSESIGRVLGHLEGDWMVVEFAEEFQALLTRCGEQETNVLQAPG